MLFDAFKCLLGDHGQEYTREQLSAELFVFDYLEGLLEDVEASADLQLRFELEGAQTLNHGRVISVVQHRVFKLSVYLGIRLLR